MPNRLRILFLLAAVSEFANAACRTTFESFVCQADDAVPKPVPPVTAPSAWSAPKFEVKQPPRSWLTPYRAFEISMAGAIAADSMSSWGCFESNPILRSPDGRFGARGMAVKVGISGGGLLAAHLLRRKYPKLEKPLTFVFAGGSAWLHGVAIRNRAVGCWR